MVLQNNYGSPLCYRLFAVCFASFTMVVFCSLMMPSTLLESSTLQEKIGEEQVYQHDITNLFPATKCDENQRANIRRVIGNAKTLSSNTHCPDASWIEEFYEKEADSIANGTSFLGINVGCNKGNDAIRTARMGMSTPDFNESGWNKAIGDAGRFACRGDGNRAEFKLNPPRRKKGEMHCIEPMPATYQLLLKTRDQLDLGSKNFVVTNAAIAAANGAVQFPDSAAGVEHLGIHNCDNVGVECKTVPLFNLDSYVRKFVSSKGPVHILQIDTEGWDFNVLFGAGTVLDRTHYLEFENHESGNWGSLHVTDAVRLLDSKGFTCYWAGVKKLWRITECYFEESNDWRGWSNVACVHRSQYDLLSIMEAIFLTTIR